MKLWVLVHCVVSLKQQIRDKVTDFYLDNIDVKHLEADMKDGVLVIAERKDDANETKAKD